MAVLGVTSWTVTITERGQNDNKRFTRGTLLLAGVDTYPTGGIPLPTRAQFGFVRQLDTIELVGQASAITSYDEQWDKVNQKLQLYVSHDTAGITTLPMDEEDAAGVPGPRTWDFLATGW